MPATTPSPHPWGRLDVDLLYDPARYGPYAAAHHIAGHHWALWRLGESFGPVGLSVVLPSVARETATHVEASAVLIEAIAIEYLLDLHRLADFGIEERHVNWNAVSEHTVACSLDARERGCRRHALRALRHLRVEGWVRRTGMSALSEWDEISALAEALGRGRVLEPTRSWRCCAGGEEAA